MAGAASSGKGKEMEMVEPKAGFKSDVWKHFGFSLKRNEKGEKVTDKENTVCRHCQTVVKYKSGNTTNMRSHLLNHHPEKLREDTRSKIQSGQKTIKEAFTASLPHNSAGAQEITRCIGEYIAKDLRPFSVVDNEGFKRLVNMLEPKYKISSRPHFSQTVLPALYKETRAKVEQSLKQAECISITTDGWTSQATQSYVTITAHAMTSEWEIKTFVLQTRVLFESHTGHNIGEVLKSAVSEWELDMIYNNNHQGIAVFTDNARNMGVAVKEAGLSPHVKCFAHTLNFASQAGLKVNRVSRLLGRVRRVAAFFHRSSTATAVLTSKQRMLNLPVHKLIMDVITRWNSSLDMIERYLEQEQAIAAALLSSEVRHNAREIDNLEAADIADAEDIVKLLTPLKKATTVLCDESQPTISLIMPLKHMIQVSMAPCDVDSNTVSQMKAAILIDLADRYQGEQAEFLYESSALDPRFRALPHLNNSERDEIFNRLKLKATQMQNQNPSEEEGAAPGSHEHVVGHSKTDLPQKAHAVGGFSPPSKKTALEDLLGDSFSQGDSRTQHTAQIDAEIDLYRKETSISLMACPLEWWKDNAQRYPLLSTLTKSYLSVPATSIPNMKAK
ncbi:E3 SUMO-protein ligase ZBED1 [Labeo rohita]|uniref:E3 SUMO-protein ligase ZBED1 n=1 Tax=Labeo rohita TaxID=84645 RepID=UPI0021E32A0F|nr:E3 SUMO-protein ligase ZBED1 [Labeo rohita]